MNLEQFAALTEKASPGEWIANDFSGVQNVTCGDIQICSVDAENDIDFIAACREMVPKLIAVAKAADKLLNHPEPPSWVSCGYGKGIYEQGFYEDLAITLASLENEMR